MKRIRISILMLLSVASLTAPVFQSSAMVPVPESVRQSKEKEKTLRDPNTTVIESGKSAIFVPPTPSYIAIFVPPTPRYQATVIDTGKSAIFVPPTPSYMAIFVPPTPRYQA
jgi:hypothetical protein